MGIAIVMYLCCRTLWGDIEGCVMDVDVMVRSNAVEVLHLVADHGITRLHIEANKNPLERWQVCCSFILGNMPRDALAMCFVWLSTEVGTLIQFVQRPRHSTWRKINVAKVQPSAHTFRQSSFAVMCILVLDGSLSLGMLILLVSFEISTWDCLQAKLAVLFAPPFSDWRSHTKVNV
jgi:hypothetical protein